MCAIDAYQSALTIGQTLGDNARNRSPMLVTGFNWGLRHCFGFPDARNMVIPTCAEVNEEGGIGDWVQTW